MFWKTLSRICCIFIVNNCVFLDFSHYTAIFAEAAIMDMSSFCVDFCANSAIKLETVSHFNTSHADPAFSLKSEPMSSAACDVMFGEENNYMMFDEKQRWEIDIFNDPGLPVKSENESSQDFDASFHPPTNVCTCSCHSFYGATPNFANSISNTEDNSTHHVAIINTPKTQEQHLTLPVIRARRPSTSHTAIQLTSDAKLPRLEVQQLIHVYSEATSPAITVRNFVMGLEYNYVIQNI